MSRKIEVQILGDSKSLEAALGRAQKKTSNFGRALSVGAKVGAGALLGLGVAAKIGFDEFIDSQKVMKQTNAVIKSTGGVANVTASHVNALAQQMLQLSGVDDETVAAGENVLLTFRNIQNTKTNKTFDEATKAALNLSVAMGRDMSQSALMVGKALNDPVKGLTALRRVGVQFSAGQEAMIKHLVKTGHTAKAQQMILKELNKEFGGSAKAAGQTLPAQLSKLREGFADVAAGLIQQLLPAFNDMLGVLQSAVGWMKQNKEATKLITLAIAGLAAGIIVVNAVYKAWSAVTKVVAAAQWLLNAALSANPVALIVIGIIALGAALVIAYKKSETFRNIVNGAFNAVKSAATTVWNFLRGPLTSAFDALKGVARTLVGVWKTEFGIAENVVQGVINVVKHLWGWVQTVIGALQTLWDKAQSVAGFLNSQGSATASPGGGGVGFGGHPNPGVAVAGGSRVMHVHVEIDGREIGRAVVAENTRYTRQNGRGLLA